jgi:hypothetical protein
MTKMECSVCWNTTEDKLTPCSHPLCNSCAERWLPKSITCPICRKTVVAAALDTPSDARVVVVCIRKKAHLGLTLSGSACGNGVVVSHTNPTDAAARAGLLRGDVITHLNRIPISRHDEAIRLFNVARDIGHNVECTLAPRKSRWCFPCR